MEQSQQAVDPNGGLSSGGCTGISLLNRLGFCEKGEGGLESNGKDQHQGTSGEQRRQQSGQIGSILAVQRLQQPQHQPADQRTQGAACRSQDPVLRQWIAEQGGVDRKEEG